MPRPTRAIVNLSALTHNLSVIRHSVPMGTPLWAVVKANAYGHGLLGVVDTIEEADGLALIEIDAAIALRQRGIGKPILLLEGPFDPADCVTIIAQRLTPVIVTARQIDWFESVLGDRPLPVYIKYNSGMNRLGFPDEAIADAIKRLERLGCPITLMSHFANADTSLGIEAATAKVDALAEDFPHLPHCLANSAAIFRYPITHRQGVRSGLSLYGASSFADVSAEALGLKPVMTLKSRIIATQSIQLGEAVGYGSRFVANRSMRIGIVAIGYGDGYPQQAPDGTPVLIEGRRCPLTGRVSMDMLCVDLTDHPAADVGSSVTLWGDGLPVDEVASHLGTSAYELFCRLADRVPVLYRRRQGETD